MGRECGTMWPGDVDNFPEKRWHCGKAHLRKFTWKWDRLALKYLSELVAL